ncbi:uncharacterized protein [Porites lutea]|uniref:uncharacterized protein n=1 Tax=Porites lutea TaxID=51062 RepID=UPI003CC56492
MFLRKIFVTLAGVWVLVAASTSFKLNSLGNSLNEDSCECSNFTCSCCQPISVYRFTDMTCVNISSVDAVQNDINYTLSLGGKLYIDSTYKDQEPWPSCAEFDEQGIAYVCVIFYNTTFSATQVSGCVKLNVLVETEIILPMKCFTLQRPKAIAIDNKSQAAMARK